MSRLAPWRPSDLPHPPVFTLANAVRVIGPSTILLGISLGAGDWLLGPAVVVKHGPSVLWICTVSVILQALLNTEMARYTLATGEPITTGFMRTPPGPRFWALSYSGLYLLQVGWPGWALAAGSALAALCLGRMPREEDRFAVLALGHVVFIASVVLAIMGRRMHRVIERAEWIMMAWTLLFLLALGVLLVPASTWSRVAAGFLAPLLGASGPAPTDTDWLLLTAFAAYAGAGGLINATYTHWLRDKGFGMAGAVTTTPAWIGGQRIPLRREAAVFPITDANLAKWRQWWRYLRADLWYIWTVGCLLGMGLPALLAARFIAPGTDLGGPGAGAVLAAALGRGQGLLLWVLTLLTAAWLLFSAQLWITQGCARSVADFLFTAGSGRRGDPAAGAARVYAATLAVFTLGGSVAIAIADPLDLIVIGGNIAAVNFVILSFHTLWTNRRLLPPELRPPLWREVGVALCGLFFAGLSAAGLWRAPVPPLGWF